MILNTFLRSFPFIPRSLILGNIFLRSFPFIPRSFIPGKLKYLWIIFRWILIYFLPPPFVHLVSRGFQISLLNNSLGEKMYVNKLFSGRKWNFLISWDELRNMIMTGDDFLKACIFPLLPNYFRVPYFLTYKESLYN